MRSRGCERLISYLSPEQLRAETELEAQSPGPEPKAVPVAGQRPRQGPQASPQRPCSGAGGLGQMLPTPRRAPGRPRVCLAAALSRVCFLQRTALYPGGVCAGPLRRRSTAVIPEGPEGSSGDGTEREGT